MRADNNGIRAESNKYQTNAHSSTKNRWKTCLWISLLIITIPVIAIVVILIFFNPLDFVDYITLQIMPSPSEKFDAQVMKVGENLISRGTVQVRLRSRVGRWFGLHGTPVAIFQGGTYVCVEWHSNKELAVMHSEEVEPHLKKENCRGVQIIFVKQSYARPTFKTWDNRQDSEAEFSGRASSRIHNESYRLSERALNPDS